MPKETISVGTPSATAPFYILAYLASDRQSFLTLRMSDASTIVRLRNESEAFVDVME